MFLYYLLSTLFFITCFLLILLILIQQGKGNAGLGALSGGTQTLFGGSGGQDLFQKTTWVLGALFMAGSFFLAIMRTQQTQSFGSFEQAVQQSAPMPQERTQAPEQTVPAPTATPAPASEEPVV